MPLCLCRSHGCEPYALNDHPMNAITLARTLALLAVGMTASLRGQEFDVVILNGRVMDPETQYDKVSNVGIKGGRIVKITTEEITGTDMIDASGQVVAPGFIDTHTHSSDKYSIKMSMMDGVTTGLDLELGGLNIGEWYQREEGSWPMNYGMTVSHEMARMVVHDGLVLDEPIDAYNIFDLRAESVKDDIPGWSVTVSDLEQINQITKILDENLRQGAIGIGCTPGYASNGISTYEQFEVQRAAARYERLCGFHTRFHTSSKAPTEAPLGFAEVFTNACLLKAPLLISHDNDYGWWEIEEKLAMAREMGMNMWAEYYPYTAGSGSIGADGFKPSNIEDTLGLKYEDMLYDPTQDKYLNKEEYLKAVKEDPGRTVIGFNPAREEWLPFWLKMPHMTVGSDAMWSRDPSLKWDDDPAKFSGHPRTSGSHAITLRLAREAEVPLIFTLAQLSDWSALHLGNCGLESMKVRGRMQEAMVADIVIFDAARVKEGSSYKAGEQGLPPIGIPHVMVNGVFVKRDSKATDQFPGLPIRYPVEDKPRHVEASQRQWLKDFTIDGSPLAPKTSHAPTGHKTQAVAVHSENEPDHEPKMVWFGDQAYRSIGYCCEWHRLRAKVARGEAPTVALDPFDPLSRLRPPSSIPSPIGN